MELPCPPVVPVEDAGDDDDDDEEENTEDHAQRNRKGL